MNNDYYYEKYIKYKNKYLFLKGGAGAEKKQDGAKSISTDIVSTNQSFFIVEVLTNKYNDKVYRCPICKIITGTFAVTYPKDPNYFGHSKGCPNNNKYPLEPGVLKSIQSQIDIEVQRYTESVLQISPIDILKNLNPTNKTLILIGEEHTINTSPFFNDIILRQLKLIKLISRVYDNNIHVHHEMSEQHRKKISEKDVYHSTFVVRKLIQQLGTQKITLSTVINDTNRNIEYIMEFFEIKRKFNPKCIVSILGIVHINRIREMLSNSHILNDYNVILINSMSEKQFIVASIKHYITYGKISLDIIKGYRPTPPFSLELDTQLNQILKVEEKKK
jgi:hypothetical protein